jgi:multidrug resistance protein MdtO
VGAGVLGWGTEVFLLPQLDSLVEYVLLFASVVWIGSWVATSGPRIAFAGFQMVLAYNLVSLNTFTINTSLVPARDVVLAIMLGFVAMWLVFDHLWAQTSGASVRNLLLGTLREVAQFKSDSADSPAEANQRLIAESSKINREFDKLRDVADFYAFESFPKKPHESLVNRTIQTLLPEVRALLLIKTGLLQQRQLNPNKPVELLIQDVEVRTSDMLLGLANAIEVESPDQLSAWSLADEELRARVSLEETTARDSRNLSTLTEMRLCASLLDLASDLERQARASFLVENGSGDRIGDWTVGTIAET